MIYGVLYAGDFLKALSYSLNWKRKLRMEMQPLHDVRQRYDMALEGKKYFHLCHIITVLCCIGDLTVKHLCKSQAELNIL